MQHVSRRRCITRWTVGLIVSCPSKSRRYLSPSTESELNRDLVFVLWRGCRRLGETKQGTRHIHRLNGISGVVLSTLLLFGHSPCLAFPPLRLGDGLRPLDGRHQHTREGWENRHLQRKALITRERLFERSVENLSREESRYLGTIRYNFDPRLRSTPPEKLKTSLESR